MTVMTPAGTRCPAALIEGIRSATRQHADWQRTAELVAHALKENMPGQQILTEEERAGDPDEYRCHILHVEPDGSFSVTAMVWQPGQVTPVHDHVTWCVFGVVQGTEYEELYALTPDGGHLTEVGRSQNKAGDISGFAPPGDIHRVRNYGQDVAISIHVYGADITRLGSSIRRTYDLPVVSLLPG
jgi:3-mercaptopropionate dioxygenase